jgi:hypothetical protein
MESTPYRLNRRTVLGATLAAAVFGLGGRPAFAQNDPLPSWNDGATKSSITGFVAAVTTAGGPDFVPVGSSHPCS